MHLKDATGSVDSKTIVNAIDLDLSKTFDKVPFKSSIEKLMFMIEKWLSEWKQTVVLRCTPSERRPVNSKAL